MKLRALIVLSLSALFLFIISLIFSYRYAECGGGSCGISLFDQLRGRIVCLPACIETYYMGWPWSVWTNDASESRIYLDNLVADYLFYFLVSLMFLPFLMRIRYRVKG